MGNELQLINSHNSHGRILMHRRVLFLVLLLAGFSSAQEQESGPGDISEPQITVDRFDTFYWKPKRKVAATYPRIALMKRVEGCANVSYIIANDGKVMSAAVTKSIPGGMFDDSSISAVEAFVFEPTNENPASLPVRTNTIMTFTVNGGRSPEYWANRCEIHNDT